MLGPLLSSWTFLPTILAMSKGGPVLAIGPLLKTSLKSLIKGFITTMRINNEGGPQFYCDVFVMLLTVSPLFNRTVSIRAHSNTHRQGHPGSQLPFEPA